MFDPPEALVSHTLSKSYYLIHELFPPNLLSFDEPVNFGTPYLPLPFLNLTTYFASNLTSTNWISSPYLSSFPSSFCLCQGFVMGSIGLSLTVLTKTTALERSEYLFMKEMANAGGKNVLNKDVVGSCYELDKIARNLLYV